jgi:hypothetical protein
MRFTDSPFESMMREIPPAPRPVSRKAPVGSVCRDCPYWRGMACVGVCCRELTSEQFVPKRTGGQSDGSP